MNRRSAIVVFVIVITMAGLGVANIQRMRDAAARTQCANNLKMLGLSLHSYLDANKERFPCALASPPTENFPPERHFSWLFAIDSYIHARMDDTWFIDPSQPWDEQRFRHIVTSPFLLFLCPANPAIGDPYPYTHYVGITGVGKDAAWLPLDHPDAGLFGYVRKVRREDVKRGLGNTIAVAETATDNGPWAIGGYGTARGLDRNGTFYLGEEGQFNSFHGRHYLIADPFITHVVMADASVRVLTDSMPDERLEALATLAGGD